MNQIKNPPSDGAEMKEIKNSSSSVFTICMVKIIGNSQVDKRALWTTLKSAVVEKRRQMSPFFTCVVLVICGPTTTMAKGDPTLSRLYKIKN